jgi:hypothetical protein
MRIPGTEPPGVREPAWGQTQRTGERDEAEPTRRESPLPIPWPSGTGVAEAASQLPGRAPAVDTWDTNPSDT